MISWLDSRSTFQPNSAPPRISGKICAPVSPSFTRTPCPRGGPCTGMGAEGWAAAGGRDERQALRGDGRAYAECQPWSHPLTSTPDGASVTSNCFFTPPGASFEGRPSRGRSRSFRHPVGKYWITLGSQGARMPASCPPFGGQIREMRMPAPPREERASVARHAECGVSLQGLSLRRGLPDRGWPPRDLPGRRPLRGPARATACRGRRSS